MQINLGPGRHPRSSEQIYRLVPGDYELLNRREGHFSLHLLRLFAIYRLYKGEDQHDQGQYIVIETQQRLVAKRV
jgi:hypothetical protein